MGLTLYDLAGAEENRRFSPYCWRVKMALAHKALAFETVPWHFTEKDVIAFSGQGLVPVLVDGDRVLADSWAILQYLEKTYPSDPPLAEGPQAWAYANFIRNWTERSLQTAISRIILLDVLGKAHPKDQGYFRASREARLGTSLEAFVADRAAHLAHLHIVLDPLRALVRTQPFVGGGLPSVADYVVLGAFQWARCTSPAQLLEVDDPVYAWRERVLALHGGVATSTLGYPTVAPEARP